MAKTPEGTARMAIYTLPGPIYDYSVGLVSFDADVIEFTLDGTRSGSASAKEKSSAGGGSQKGDSVATMKLSVKSLKGLSNVMLSITPSDSDIKDASVAPVNALQILEVVGNSQTLQEPFLRPRETRTLTVRFRRFGTAPAQVTFSLSADELTDTVSVNLTA
jgi:hypothetical protein